MKQEIDISKKRGLHLLEFTGFHYHTTTVFWEITKHQLIVAVRKPVITTRLGGKNFEEVVVVNIQVVFYWGKNDFFEK